MDRGPRYNTRAIMAPIPRPSVGQSGPAGSRGEGQGTGFTQDVTERKRAEETLKYSRNRFETSFREEEKA